ncbi:MAG: DUF309 domain-containing protein, partial [Planctomycetaceae bacterium]|nr:DUF309 domain-containing protein [Planctomycetaceae bacterium]
PGNGGGREQCSGDGGMMSDEFALPPYTYVPGRSPHPVSDERGHAFGQASPDDWTAGDWRECCAYHAGRRLFAAGYYWEAHEAWEAVWLRLGRKGAEADFVKGLIKLAAAGVKCLEGNAIGATRHARRAAELFAVAGDLRGVGADRWRHVALTIADEPPVCDPPSEGSYPSPLRGFVLAE